MLPFRSDEEQTNLFHERLSSSGSDSSIQDDISSRARFESAVSLGNRSSSGVQPVPLPPDAVHNHGCDELNAAWMSDEIGSQSALPIVERPRDDAEAPSTARQGAAARRRGTGIDRLAKMRHNEGSYPRRAGDDEGFRRQ